MCTGMLARRYPAANGGLREVRDPGGPGVRGTEGPRDRERGSRRKVPAAFRRTR
jgi:hypothetical protein